MVSTYKKGIESMTILVILELRNSGKIKVQALERPHEPTDYH